MIESDCKTCKFKNPLNICHGDCEDGHKQEKKIERVLTFGEMFKDQFPSLGRTSESLKQLKKAQRAENILADLENWIDEMIPKYGLEPNPASAMLIVVKNQMGQLWQKYREKEAKK